MRRPMHDADYGGSDGGFFDDSPTARRTLKGGTETYDHHVIEVPPTCEVVGLFGRSGSEIDRLGLLMSDSA